jgi:sodium-independent sulfate anion transporter 11
MSGLLMLSMMEFAGERWGKRYCAIWYPSLSRNTLALVLFTSISYGVNKGLKISIFGISKMTGSGIKTSKVPDPDLIPRIAACSIPIFIAAAL